MGFVLFNRGKADFTVAQISAFSFAIGLRCIEPIFFKDAGN